MTHRGNPPSAWQIAQWIGKAPYEYWKRVTELIEQNYPEVFAPDWLFGG
jgi:hypothetical protein